VTSKDGNNMTDAEFEAFLQGRGELSDLLQAMPQPMPSAELDAAILADAEAALGLQAARTDGAANDAVIPQTQRIAPNFLSRWKIPLGLAASVLLAIPLVMLQRQGPSSNEAPVVVAAAPAGPAPVARRAENPQQEELTGAAAKDADHAKLAKADAATSTQTRARATAPMPSSATGKIGVPGVARPARKAEDAPTVLAQADTGAPRQEPVQIAQAPSPIVTQETAPPPAAAAMPPAKPAAPAAIPEQLAAAPQAKETTAANARMSRGMTSADKAPEVLAKTDSQDAKAKRGAEPQSEYHIAAAPSAAPAAAPPPPVQSAASGDGANAIASPPVLGGQATGQASEPASPENARSWILQIEKLLKADKRKEVLDEWTRFRLAYPDYPVRKSLLKQIDALKK
jgi:hypothetical protein